jgi:hypothetical protein
VVQGGGQQLKLSGTSFRLGLPASLEWRRIGIDIGRNTRAFRILRRWIKELGEKPKLRGHFCPIFPAAIPENYLNFLIVNFCGSVALYGQRNGITFVCGLICDSFP